MSEMIERVAQAICGDNNPANILEIHRVRARAAIEAMREPDEVMIQRAYEAVEFNDCWQIEDGPDFLKAYHAVIDEALK